MPKAEEAHTWAFRARFRRHAFGWKSQPAIQRIKEAVSEIKKVAKKDKLLAAEGAVLFLEKMSPALEQVDSSSGAIGNAVNHAIAELVAIIASAPADKKTRETGWSDSGKPTKTTISPTSRCSATTGARCAPRRTSHRAGPISSSAPAKMRVER